MLPRKVAIAKTAHTHTTMPATMPTMWYHCSSSKPETKHFSSFDFVSDHATPTAICVRLIVD